MQQPRAPRTVYLARVGFLLSAVTLIGFTAFDVIVGDRAEVLEHNIYFALIVLTWYLFGRRPVPPKQHVRRRRATQSSESRRAAKSSGDTNSTASHAGPS